MGTEETRLEISRFMLTLASIFIIAAAILPAILGVQGIKWGLVCMAACIFDLIILYSIIETIEIKETRRMIKIHGDLVDNKQRTKIIRIIIYDTFGVIIATLMILSSIYLKVK